MARTYPHDSDPPPWRIIGDALEPVDPPAPERGPVA